MPKWNMFSEEVVKERKRVRDYGLDKIQNRVPEQDTYKSQALRQLAMRLELEDYVKSLESRIAELIDKVEDLETKS